MSPVTAFFASELRRARQNAGMSQEQLASAMLYSPSLIAQVETGRKPPSPSFVKRADEALKTDGLFERILEGLLLKDVTPEWLRPWFVIEQAATALRAYQPLVVYGLLQTEDYAREILRSDDPERTENRVAARIERQQVLARERPPSVVMLIDESVLHRQVGTRDMMYRQLMHLLSAPAVVQVVPTEAQTYLGVDGAFELADYDGREVVYIDTPARGFVLDGVEIISEARERWEALRAEALPLRQSRQLIVEVAESWKN